MFRGKNILASTYNLIPQVAKNALGNIIDYFRNISTRDV